MLNKEINISNIYTDSQKLIVLLNSARLGLSFLKPISFRFKNTQLFGNTLEYYTESIFNQFFLLLF